MGRESLAQLQLGKLQSGGNSFVKLLVVVAAALGHELAATAFAAENGDGAVGPLVCLETLVCNRL